MTHPASPLVEREAARRTAPEQREYERCAVARHYEHDAAIFQLVLGRRLAYSTGIFDSPTDDLDTAQERKLAHIKDLLAIGAAEDVLDVGCGWGSALLYLAEHTPGRLRGITLSERQREFTRARARALGVAGRTQVDVCHLEDLALAPASLDAVVFIGSIVHMHNRAAVHRFVGRALRPGGRLVISDCYFPAVVRGDRESTATHFILAETLGYCRLLGLSEELGAIEAAGLDVTSVEDLTASYVRTLGCWIDNVRRHRAGIEALAPGFAKVLQSYMSVARLSFKRRTALEYLILATKGASAATPA